MGFKADTSFLRFLTMGVLGVQQTMKQLRAAGFKPIELERYCASNKIWATKVKRLRLPDVLCVKTGIRVEVRAKSKLQIRMSDAPGNPERTWDANMGDNDLAAFVAILDDADGQRPAESATFFTVGDLRRSQERSKLGQRKSASEGAERDRVWPAIIPSQDGEVLSVDSEKLLVKMQGREGRHRAQSFRLKNKHPYVQPGDLFKANVTILAGAPSRLADLEAFQTREYDLLSDLGAEKAVDRYAAVKALRHRKDMRAQAIPLLESLLEKERDWRVALEAAGSATLMGSNLGQEHIENVLRGEIPEEWSKVWADLRMEAVLILSEIGSPFAQHQLVRLANDQGLKGDEIRQAAVWGLGKAGLKAYGELSPFIDDADENVALHAIVAFDSKTPEFVIRQLAGDLVAGSPRRAAAASEALRTIGSETVVRVLAETAMNGCDWVVATLGRLPPELVRRNLQGSDLLSRIAPMLLLNEKGNWLASEDRTMDLAFLTKQSLYMPLTEYL